MDKNASFAECVQFFTDQLNYYASQLKELIKAADDSDITNNFGFLDDSLVFLECFEGEISKIEDDLSARLYP